MSEGSTLDSARFYAGKAVFACRLLARQWRSSPTDDGVLRIIATHHKTGTFLVHQIFRSISRKHGLRYFAGPQAKLPSGTEIWLQDQSHIDRRALGRPYLGIHLIRHPYEMVASAYRYHLQCQEKWCLDPTFPSDVDGRRWSIDGQSYQAHLRSLPPHRGLAFELEGYSRGVLEGMLAWDYDDERFLECRFEEFRADFDRTVERMLHHLGLNALGTKRLVRLAARYDLRHAAADEIARNLHVTNKQMKESTYQDIFVAEHYALMKEQVSPQVLAKLGYDVSIGSP